MAKIKVEFQNGEYTEALITVTSGFLWWKKSSSAVVFKEEKLTRPYENVQSWWYKVSRYWCEYEKQIIAEEDRQRKAQDWIGTVNLPRAIRVK